jgi:hypothetical protein
MNEQVARQARIDAEHFGST